MHHQPVRPFTLFRDADATQPLACGGVAREARRSRDGDATGENPHAERPMLMNLPLMPSAASPADTRFQRLLCCIRGQSTGDADDCVLLGISTPGIPAEQWLGRTCRTPRQAEGASVKYRYE